MDAEGRAKQGTRAEAFPYVRKSILNSQIDLRSANDCMDAEARAKQDARTEAGIHSKSL